MPIHVQVRNERGERVGSLEEMIDHVPSRGNASPAFGVAPFPRFPHDDWQSYPMLSSVDPYGLTYFNRRQLPRLLHELDAIQADDPDDAMRSFIAGLRILTAQHMRAPHRFLWFIGD